MEFPSGVVTFVFTDLEGSTKLFRSLGDSYIEHLERHNALLRAAWSSHEGVEVKTEGDSFFVAFADPMQAVLACIDAQRSMADATWPDEHPFKTRIGIHSGVAQPRGNDYIAFSVHQAARIEAVGHGGQIVVSPATAELLDLGGADFALEDLGLWRVRDFDGPIRLSQVAAAGLETSFAPLRTRPADTHNLRRTPDLFVGREAELEEIVELVTSSPLTTLAGPGGVGKTRVAVEVGLALADRQPDGVWFADLSAASDRAGVERRVLDAIAPESSADGLASELVDKSCLLILDNCEQVVEPVAELVDEIVHEAPSVSLLVTTREPLDSVNERVWRLGPLSDVDSMIDLFIDRASRRGAGNDADRSTIADICRRVDGHPLSIELAAARAGLMSAEEILAGLDDALSVLKVRRKRGIDRQSSLEALVDWSYQLLAPEERETFRRLSLFAGTFDLESARAAASLGSPTIDDELPEVMWALIDKSLVVADTSEASTRFRLLMPLRSFGRAQLHAEDEDVRCAAALAAWFVRDIDPVQLLRPESVERFTPDRHTMASLLPIVAHVDPVLALTVAWCLARWASASRRELDGLDLLSAHHEVLSKTEALAVDLVAEIAFLHQQVGDLDACEAAIASARSLKSDGLEARWGLARLEIAEAYLNVRRGDLDEAARVADSIVQFAEPHDRVSLLNVLGHVASERHDDEQLRQCFIDGLAAARQIDWPYAETTMMSGLVESSIRIGDAASAVRYLAGAIELDRQLGVETNLALNVLNGARLAALELRWTDAATLQACGERLIAEAGMKLFPRDIEINEELWANIAGVLSPDQVEASRARSAEWDSTTAIDFVLKHFDAGELGSKPNAPDRQGARS